MFHEDTIDALEKEIGELSIQLAKALIVIKWYADPAHWTIDYVDGNLGDWGKRAREFLEANKQ